MTVVRVDAGGTLNGQLLAAGLVDEIDIIVAPQLAGTEPIRSIWSTVWRGAA